MPLVLLILAYFPHQMQDELEDIMEPAEEDGKLKLMLIVKFLIKLRKKRQAMQKTAEHAESSSISGGGGNTSSSGGDGDTSDGGGSNSDGGGGKKKNGGGKFKSKFLPTSAVVYAPPQRDEKCRICTQLQNQGDIL